MASRAIPWGIAGPPYVRRSLSAILRREVCSHFESAVSWGSGAGSLGGEQERGATRGWSCLGWKTQHVPVQWAVSSAAGHGYP